MGLSTLSYLRSIYPNSKIYYGIRAWTQALYSEVECDADQVLALDFDNFKGYMKTWKLLSSLDIDHIHELHLSGRSEKFFSLFSLLKGIKYTYHNHHLSSQKSDVVDHGKIKPLIQRDLDGVYTFLGKSEKAPSYLDFPPQFKIRKSCQTPCIIFGVVATRATKMWKLDYYIELARKIKSIHRDIRIIIPLSSSQADKKIRDQIELRDGNSHVELVELPLSALAETFSECLLYIGNDTGLKHIAIASGIKTYTFFGPEPPHEWHPYDNRSHPYFYIDGLECRTREAHFCGLSECDSMICMDQISPDQVFKEVKKDIEVFFEQ